MRLQAFARRMDVVDGEGEVAEIACAAVILVVVVPGQLDLDVRIRRRGKVDQGEAALRDIAAAGSPRPCAC